MIDVRPYRGLTEILIMDSVQLWKSRGKAKKNCEGQNLSWKQIQCSKLCNAEVEIISLFIGQW